MLDIHKRLISAIKKGEEFADGPGYGSAAHRDLVQVFFDGSCLYSLHGSPVLVTTWKHGKIHSLRIFLAATGLMATRINAMANYFGIEGVRHRENGFEWWDGKDVVFRDYDAIGLGEYEERKGGI